MPVSIEPARRWTAAEVRAMQDESRHWPRYELIDGALLMTNAPTWPHQRAIAVLLRALDAYVRAHSLGEVVLSPADLELETGNITQPDVFVVPRGYPGSEWSEIERLLVATEVLSPSTARYDRVVKRAYYLRNGVPEYWIVDLDARVIERWRPDDMFHAAVVDDVLEWRPDGVTEPFRLDLTAFFAEVHREVPNA